MMLAAFLFLLPHSEGRGDELPPPPLPAPLFAFVCPYSFIEVNRFVTFSQCHFYSSFNRYNHIPVKEKRYRADPSYFWPWGVWYHVVMAYMDGIGMAMYLNGCLLKFASEETATAYSFPSGTPDRLTIGCVSDVTLHDCNNMMMDDLYLWHAYKYPLFVYHLYTINAP